MFPGADIGEGYNPYEPKKDAVRCFSHNEAKSLRSQRFSERAREMIKVAWPESAAYYACYMERNGGQNSRL
jgi:hypothetical protein